jgi:uncharacterized SAM-binding protein YcdF (DUF218 family)
MFVVDKVLTLLLLPTALMVELVLLGLILSRWQIGRILLIMGVGAMTACLILPVDSLVIRPLEDRFPAITTSPEKVDGIVVLGGAIDEVTSRDRGTPTLTSAANRLTTFVMLAERYPGAKLVFTGGSGAIDQGVANEAEYARILFGQLGLAPDRVVFEDKSRTTWENAVNAYELVKPRPSEHWILLTSAAHVPRAVGVFCRIGWNALPWPVGYKSRDHISAYGHWMGQKLEVLDWAAHEWIGLAVYFLEGRTSALFPYAGPKLSSDSEWRPGGGCASRQR